MENFGKKPSETEYLSKYSQAKSAEEKAQIKAEYEAQEKAYWDWVDKVSKKEKPHDHT